MTSITGIQETPGLSASSIVFTVGSKDVINAKAERVFEIVTDSKNYSKWNSWTPTFEIEGEEPIHLGSSGILTARMPKQNNKEYRTPVKVIEFSTSPERYVIAWRASLLPTWFSVAERIHIITPIGDGSSCEAKQIESMSGWGAYLMKYIFGIQKQLQELGLVYIKDLKDYAEANP